MKLTTPVEAGQRCRSNHDRYRGEITTVELIEAGDLYYGSSGELRRAHSSFWVCWYPGVVGPYRVTIHPRYLEVIQ